MTTVFMNSTNTTTVFLKKADSTLSLQKVVKQTSDIPLRLVAWKLNARGILSGKRISRALFKVFDPLSI